MPFFRVATAAAGPPAVDSGASRRPFRVPRAVPSPPRSSSTSRETSGEQVFPRDAAAKSGRVGAQTDGRPVSAMRPSGLLALAVATLAAVSFAADGAIAEKNKFCEYPVLTRALVVVLLKNGGAWTTATRITWDSRTRTHRSKKFTRITSRGEYEFVMSYTRAPRVPRVRWELASVVLKCV